VETINPRGGVVDTATSVLITGSGFSQDSSVSFGGVRATPVQVLTPTFIVAMAPAGASTAEATVTTPAGTYSGPSGPPLADVTADSMDSEAQWHVNFDPFNVVDGNLNSFWGSGETAMPHRVQVRFTHPVTLGKVVVQARRLDGLVINNAAASASASGSVLADTIRVEVTAESYQGSPRIEADIAQWTPTGCVDSRSSGTTVCKEIWARGFCTEEVHRGVQGRGRRVRDQLGSANSRGRPKLGYQRGNLG
jgi:hypothetical protein